MSSPTVARVSFKEQMLQAREDAIVQAVNRLLAEKGFDAMTVDEIAASVGIAKASVYKHFPSKEDLAAAAMVRVLHRTQDFLLSLPAQGAPLDKLKAVVRWALELQLAGEMPSLPGQNCSLRTILVRHQAWVDGLHDLSARLGGWTAAAQADGSLNPRLPASAVLCTLYARACDPVLGFLKAGGQHGDAELVELVMSTCFEGLNAR